MSEFAQHRQKVRDGLAKALAEGQAMLVDMENADDRFSEQANIIASLESSNLLLREEMERLSADYQLRLDLVEQENVALRSRLSQQGNNFTRLAHSLGLAKVRVREADAIIAQGFNTVNRDATGNKIVTQLASRPQRSGVVKASDIPDSEAAPMQKFGANSRP